MKIKFQRFPWHWYTEPNDGRPGRRYGWKGDVPMRRFGGGWNWKLGIDVGRSSVILNVLIGIIRID